MRSAAATDCSRAHESARCVDDHRVRPRCRDGGHGGSDIGRGIGGLERSASHEPAGGGVGRRVATERNEIAHRRARDIGGLVAPGRRGRRRHARSGRARRTTRHDQRDGRARGHRRAATTSASSVFPSNACNVARLSSQLRPTASRLAASTVAADRSALAWKEATRRARSSSGASRSALSRKSRLRRRSSGMRRITTR